MGSIWYNILEKKTYDRFQILLLLKKEYHNP